MTEYASLADLTEGDVTGTTRDVELPNGKSVKVRGMTRFEMMLSRKGTEDATVVEQRMLSYCLVEPRMTPKQVEAWQKATTPMVIAPVTEAIRELSGLGEGADKSDPGTPGDD